MMKLASVVGLAPKPRVEEIPMESTAHLRAQPGVAAYDSYLPNAATTRQVRASRVDSPPNISTPAPGWFSLHRARPILENTFVQQVLNYILGQVFTSVPSLLGSYGLYCVGASLYFVIPIAVVTIIYFYPGEQADALRALIYDRIQKEYGDIKASIFKRSNRRNIFEAYAWLKSQGAANTVIFSETDILAYNRRSSWNPIKHQLSAPQARRIADAISADRLRTRDPERYRFLTFLRAALGECIAVDLSQPRDSVLDSYEAINCWLAKRLIDEGNYSDAHTYIAAVGLLSASVNREAPAKAKSRWHYFSGKDGEYLKGWLEAHGSDLASERDKLD